MLSAVRPLPVPSSDLATAMIGYWRLVSREDYDRDGRRHIDPVLGADPLGVLCFARDHFAAQFSSRDRSGTVTLVAGAAGANNSMAVGGYDAYFGTYTLDAGAGIITVRLDAAVAQASVGQAFTRRIRASDRELTIQLDTTTVDGTPVTRTLTFERVA